MKRVIASSFSPFFFSREESRMHVHVHCGDGEAKFWIEPTIELADNVGLSQIRIKEIEQIIKVHHVEIKVAWEEHFSR